MDRVIGEYVSAKDTLLRYFDCKDDYYIKPLIDYNWCIKQGGGISFFCYWKRGVRQVEAVIAKKDGDPLIFKKNDYSMVVAIDCVKIAFILDSAKEMLH